MTRIVYLAFPDGRVAGGQKVILRHVEALRALGFDAVVRINPTNTLPPAYAHTAPVEVGTPFRPGDILVVPSDAPNALAAVATHANRSLVFCQNQFDFAAIGMKALASYPPGREPPFIAVSPTVAAMLARAFPQARVELIPAFADERVFRPAAAPPRQAIAASPRKRRLEQNAIRGLLDQLHPRHADIPWSLLENAPEPQVARVFAASAVTLSLSRLEALGMTPLEAMACGSVVAGFTGVGGRDFATPDNGFWVPEDDCVAAADALARALDLTLTGGPPLARLRDAAFATADQWSHARFRVALEEVWMRLAPEARLRSGPLD